MYVLPMMAWEFPLSGWKREDTQVVYGVNETVSADGVGKDETVTFVAQWAENRYTVAFDSRSDAVYDSVTLDYTEPYALPRPSMTGYTFLYWTLDGKPLSESVSRLSATDGAQITLVAAWRINSYTLTLDAHSATITVTIDGEQKQLDAAVGKDGELTYSVNYGSAITATISFREEGNRTSYYRSMDSSTKYADGEKEFDFTMPASDVLIYASSNGCFASGTLVDMADGTQKRIEDIRVGDMVMTWNFVTGQKEAMPVSLYWDHGMTEREVLHLEFSDGSKVDVVAQHGFFDIDRNEIVFIDIDHYDLYVGDRFAALGGGEDCEAVVLVNAYVTTEVTGSYSLRAAVNDNVFVEGKLTLTCEDYKGMLTYFEMGEDMTYDQEKMQADIEKYGLFEYEDWAEYMTEEEFYALNGQYYSILVGKNILSYEDIYKLIEGLREI